MKYFTIEEFIKSDTAKRKGIDNTPTKIHKDNITELVNNLLDPLREDWTIYCQNNKLGAPNILITSGYRCWDLNNAIGGSKKSAHSWGCAADIKPSNGNMEQFQEFMKDWIKDKDFDQLIYEKPINGIATWLHIAYKRPATDEQRKMIFTLS